MKENLEKLTKEEMIKEDCGRLTMDYFLLTLSASLRNLVTPVKRGLQVRLNNGNTILIKVVNYREVK